MALYGEQGDRENINGDQNIDENEKNLWARILGEVQSGASGKLPSCKNVLFLGDNESGKTTLIAKLQGVEDPKKGSGLEYTYLDVKDEYRDDQTRLGVWILDGDFLHRGLLKYSLSQDTFEHTMLCLVVDMSAPWEIMDSLHRWADVLTSHIDRLKLAPEDRREYEESLVRQFQEYVEPDESQSSTLTRRGPNPLHPPPLKSEEEKVLLPLGETTLTNNLGIPIVVVVTKSDAISTLEKEHDFREEHFDFIQSSIRKFCLNYGAALFYTSVKEDKNCDLLYRYLVHRIYGFPFTMTAFVVERDSVFVPSGWDNEKKISILYESMTSIKPDDTYEEVIIKPMTSRKPIQRELELSAEDEQVFLMKQQTQLSKQPTAAQGAPPMKPGSTPKPGAPGARQGASPTAAGMAGTPVKKGAAPADNANSESVLANFFTTLLNKKTGVKGAPSPTPTNKERAAVSRDAAAELDRMTRAKKPTLSQSNSTTSSS